MIEGSRRARVVVALTMLAALLYGCGVPVQEQATRIPERRLPFGLGVEPGTTVLAVRAPTSASTTVAIGRLPISRVPLSFSYGDDIVSVARDLEQAVDLRGVLALLAAGPLPGEVPPGARSAVEPGDVLEVTVRRGLATVTLVTKFRDLPSVEQRRAVHQITLTLTALPGIGQVTFAVGDTAYAVPRLDGTPALIVSRDDFAPLVLTKIVTTTSPARPAPGVPPPR